MKLDQNGSRRFRKAQRIKQRNSVIRKTIIGTITISITLLLNTTYVGEINNIPTGSSSTSSITQTLPTPSSNSDTESVPDVSSSTPANTQETTESSSMSNVVPTPEQSKPQPTAPEQVQERKMVALSFDDGPAKTLTKELLQILKDNNANATFFVLGNRVNIYSDIISEAYKDGNEIGNHSYDHSDFTKLTKAQMESQIKTTNDEIYKITGEYPTFFRPPYGAINSTVKEVANCPLALWSIDSNDWRSISNEQVINNVMSELGDGKIILMHDIHQRTIEVCKTLLPEIKAKGYEIVSIKELYTANKIELENGYTYSKVKKN